MTFTAGALAPAHPAARDVPSAPAVARGRGGPMAAVVAFAGLIWLGPYFAWTSPLYFRTTVALFAMLYVAALARGVVRLDRVNAAVVALYLAYMAFLAAHPAGGLLAPSTGWPALVLFLLLPTADKAAAFRAFTWLFALSLMPGVVVWLLSAGGVEVPWTYLYAKRLDADLLLTGEASYYRQYVGSVVRDFGIFRLANGSTLFRLHGMYEEPGVVGTVAGLLLVAGRFRLRRRPEHVVLLAGGLMSLSLAFYVVAYAYALVRRPVAVLAATVVAAALFVALDAGQRLPLVQALILDRLAPGSTSLTGEYRTGATFLALYDQFWRAGLWTRLVGSTRDIRTLIDTGTFSYQVVVYQYGVLGFAGLLAVLAAGTLAVARGRDVWILLGAVFASIYQRPNVLSLPFAVILIGGAATLWAVGPRHGFVRADAAHRGGPDSPVAAPG